MSAAIPFKLTVAGQDAAFNLGAIDLNVTHVQLGSGNRTPNGNEVALVTPQEYSVISGHFEVSVGQHRIAAVVAGSVSTYQVSEIGLWSGVPGAGGSVLVFYWALPVSYIAVKSVGIDFNFESDIFFGGVVPGNITIVADTEFNALAMLAAHEADTDPHEGYLLKTDIVSQAEAEAGAATTPRVWTAQRVKQAVKSVINGEDAKASCRVATTANVAALSGLLVIDGITLIAGDRVLVKDQSTGSQNGIYLAGSGAWSRAEDADTGDDINGGATIPIEEGTLNSDTLWMLSNDGVVTIGTTALIFSRKDNQPQYHGQCRLTLSGGDLKLSPYNGNKIIIDGLTRTIPSAGVTLAPAGLAPATLYYIYAYINSGVMTLEASTTGHSTDATTGVEIKTGAVTRTLVGMVRPIAGPEFVDSNAQRFVLSWFNRRTIAASQQGGSNANTTSVEPTYVEISSTNRCEFLTWADDALNAAVQSTVTNSVVANVFSSLHIDTSSLTNPEIYSPAFAGWFGPLHLSGSSGATEGYHYATLYGCVTGGMGSWSSVAVFVNIRG